MSNPTDIFQTNTKSSQIFPILLSLITCILLAAPFTPFTRKHETKSRVLLTASRLHGRRPLFPSGRLEQSYMDMQQSLQSLQLSYNNQCGVLAKARVENAVTSRKLVEAEAQLRHLRQTPCHGSCDYSSSRRSTTSTFNESGNPEVTQRLDSAISQISALKMRLQVKQATVNRLKTSESQLVEELKSCRDKLKLVTVARYNDVERSKAALNSYRANQRVSSSYEADLEAKLKETDNANKDLLVARDELQQKYDDLLEELQASNDTSVNEESVSDHGHSFLSLGEVPIPLLFCLVDYSQVLHILQTSSTAVSSNSLQLNWDTETDKLLVNKSLPLLDHITAGASSELLETQDGCLSPSMKNALQAYNDGQEASLAYENFLLDKQREDQAHIQALRYENETLVADFAALLTSYKGLIQELPVAEDSEMVSPLVASHDHDLNPPS
ncbi:hypothetical protein BXZ70DRAFT_915483 [Cristinia sonorae]|uniref:Uncharacterized protein n=1 Tax=Cristinia sonorae TaxID=1940300 RepID=A0A8K0UZK1_9AGAR|nr:hypothetical protein BXZ70DRAFT_915483 [Cristinia sonorae]